MTDEFVADTGVPFRFLFALYEGVSGAPADADDAKAYWKEIGKPDFPVMADDSLKIAGATPIDQLSHPQLCALTPEFEIISCYTGHGTHETALEDVRAHAGF